MIHWVRGFFFFIRLMLIVAVSLFLTRFPGHAHLTWFDYNIHMSMGVLVAGILLFIALLFLLSGIWRYLCHIPVMWVTRRQKRRSRKSQLALIEGFSAMAAREFTAAYQSGKQALALNPEQPLNLLLTAQAAYRSGKLEEAHMHFLEMSKHPETAFLGLWGLILEAHNQQRWEDMRAYLQQATTLRPNSYWVFQELLELEVRLAAFDKASMIVEQMQHLRLISKQQSRRRQALVHWLKADLAEKEGEETLFIQTAASAHYEAPEIPAITLRLAQGYHRIGKTAKAEKILMAAYALYPHPDFGELLHSFNPDMSPLDYYRKVEKLVESAPAHADSLYILAQAARKAKLWGQARHYLALLKDQMYSQRLCRLMAELEEAEHPHQSNQAHEWWEKAANAPADATWVCACCQATTGAWHPVCLSCGAFDQIFWSSSKQSSKSRVSPETPLLLE